MNELISYMPFGLFLLGVISVVVGISKKKFQLILVGILVIGFVLGTIYNEKTRKIITNNNIESYSADYSVPIYCSNNEVIIGIGSTGLHSGGMEFKTLTNPNITCLDQTYTSNNKIYPEYRFFLDGVEQSNEDLNNLYFELLHEIN